MECKFCTQRCQKWGKQKNGLQRFYCRHCRKCQQAIYTYKARLPGIADMIPKLVCNSVGIRGMSRILQVAVNTVVKLIKQIAASITKPPVPLHRASFEIDEIRTFVCRKSNQYWVAYVLCSDTKEVIDFIVGKRNKTVLKMIVNTAVHSGVEKIKTDRLGIYQALIPKRVHQCNAYNINISKGITLTCGHI